MATCSPARPSFASKNARFAAWISGLTLALLAFASPAAAQDLWSDASESALSLRPGERLTTPSDYRVVRLDMPQMAARLASAPLAPGVGGTLDDGARLQIPLPDGGFATVRVSEASIMAPELQARYPEIRTYLAQGEGSITGRLSLTPAGFRGMLFVPQGAVYVDPYMRGDAEHYVVYYSRDLEVDPVLRGRLADEVIGESVPLDRPSGDAGRSHGETLRTYRLAVAANGEYTARFGGTVAGGLAAVVTTMNRVTGIYERDLSVSFELVPNNDQIIYTDPATDPYSNSTADINANVVNLNAVIGAANYDIGHVFTTGSGGVAGLGVVCTGSKARGTTGLPNPVGDAFDIDYVAHEMGHQFGGNHTFNSQQGACAGGNRNGPTAYEPGSGSTIQAYAGICGSDNLQNRSDALFHRISLDEITAFVTTGAGSTCGATEATGNPLPSVTAPASFTIPAGTPFALTGSATDDTPQTLTYTWEEFDLGPAGSLGNATPPLFRTFLPSASPTRYFPQLGRLVAGLAPVKGERLPTTSQTLTFRLTARDNRAGGGAIADAATLVTVDATAGPFVVTFADTPGQSFDGTATVTWDVAGTDAGDVDTPTVDIVLSTDDGDTFDTVLVFGTPNDGSEEVSFPVTTTEGRIMVRARDNVFFAVNDEAFAVTAAVQPAIAAITPESVSVEVTFGDDAQETVTVSNGASAGAANLSFAASVQNLTTDPQRPADAEARAEEQRAALAEALALALLPAPPNVKGDGGTSGGGTAHRAGGPDAFGYIFADSDEAGGPAFDFVDISGTGTELSLGDDNSASVSLPFGFPFYGALQSEVFVGSNGLLTFGSGTNSNVNTTLPSGAAPNNLIAMYWDDINPEIAGAVHTQDMGDGRFIVQFTDVPHYDDGNSTTEASTFQAILYESGQIDLQYLEVRDDASEPNSHTIGIENAVGSDGLTVVFDAPYVTDGLAIRFSPPPPPAAPWLTLAPATGLVEPGDSDQITLSFDVSALANGTYTADVVVMTTDPSVPAEVIPVSLTVSGSSVAGEDGAQAGATALLPPTPNPARGTVTLAYTLAQAGRAQVVVYDALGREVAVLLDETSAAGPQSVQLDGSALPPGVYLVRLTAGGVTSTQPFTLLR